MSMDEPRLLHVLTRGGMLVQGVDGYRVYRTQDARRGCVGLLAFEVVERLKTEGALVALCEAGQRLSWRDGHALPEGMAVSDVDVGPDMTRAKTRRAPSATVLEAVLKRIDEPQDSERLARAAMRFLRDYEAQSNSRSVTMNWSFELSGHKGGHRGAMAGLPERSLSARAALSLMTEILGARMFALVECALVKGFAQRRICADFGMSAPRVLDALRQGLGQVADAYDHHIRADI